MANQTQVHDKNLHRRGPSWRRNFDGHPCRWPGCDVDVNGHLWGCQEHWYQIPMELREKFLGCNRKRDRDRVIRSIEVHLEITL